MATGWGVDAVKNAQGEVTSGTSAQDIRRITSGLYNQGVLRGCLINTSTTSMSYTLLEGIVCNQISDVENVLMPVYTTTVTAPVNNTGATRNDYIYVKQNIPSIDGRSDIVVGVTHTKPAMNDRRLVIRRFVVPAGATRTSQASPLGAMEYAVPYGQAGRPLVHAVDTYNGLIRNRSLNDLGGNFHLPTDRLLRVDMTCTYDLEHSSYDRLFNDIYIDGVRRAMFTTGQIDTTTYTTTTWTWYAKVYRGDRNITIKRRTQNQDVHSKPSDIYFRYGANGWPGQVLTVTDAGVWDPTMEGI